MNAELMTVDAEPVGSSPTIVEQLTRGEVDMQVATAKRYPRSIQKFKQAALAMAIRTPEIAAQCFYVLPRGGKKIEGPSVHLARIVASCWGNIRTERRVIDIGETMLTAQATAWDMETNVLERNEMRRRITDSAGRRYKDDMIVVTGNAASSIAYRNAVFTVVPSAFVGEIYEHCKRVAQGERGSLGDAVKKWVEWYRARHVSREQVLALLGRDGIDSVTIEDISTLQGLATSIEEGTTTIRETFGETAPTTPENGTAAFGFKARKGNGNGASQPVAREPGSDG